MVVWFFVTNKRPFCHHLNYWILVFVVMTTKVSGLKPLIISDSYGSHQCCMDDNIFVSKNAVDFCHLRLVEWKIFMLPICSGFKCLNNHDTEFSIAFSNLRSWIFEFPTGCFKNSSLTKLPHPAENILLPHLRTLFVKHLDVSHNSSSNGKFWKQMILS